MNSHFDYYNDYHAGLSDGGDTNPYFRPGERTGPARDAYTAGYRIGRWSMDQYLDDQDESE